MGLIALAFVIPSGFVLLVALGSARAGAVDDELSERAARALTMRRLARRRGDRRQGDRRDEQPTAVTGDRRRGNRRLGDRRSDPIGIDPPAGELSVAGERTRADQLELPLPV